MEHHTWDKYAQDYHAHIISPLRENVRNPIYKDLQKISGAQRLIVADIGTGRGDLLPRLAPRFKHVYAIDFSKRMLEQARKAHGAHRNVSYLQRDMRTLADDGLRVDVAIAINSVLLPGHEDVKRSLAQIFASLKKGGTLLGIFPAMESVLYYFTLVYEREIAKYPDEKRALRNAKRAAEHRKYEFMGGVFDDDGERQKLFYEFELRTRLEEAGFTRISITKIHYPWDGSHGYDSFSGKPGLWDWYVRAHKPKS